MSIPQRIPVTALAAALSALWVGVAPGSALAEETIGRVVAVRGQVTAESPDGTSRSLQCDDPVYAGDVLKTPAEGKVGILAGGVYAGIGEKSEMTMAATDGGAPDLDLKAGHLRILDSEGGAGGSARISTPTLLAYDAGDDTEALVFPEKVAMVSMVCAYDAPVTVTRSAVGDSTRADSGQCVVAKPKESLYTAAASHPRLPVIDDDCGAPTPVAGTALDHFGTPADVALGPDVAAAAFAAPSLAPAIAGASAANGVRTPCDGDTCSGARAGGLSVGGGPPGFGNTPSPPILPPAP